MAEQVVKSISATQETHYMLWLTTNLNYERALKLGLIAKNHNILWLEPGKLDFANNEKFA